MCIFKLIFIISYSSPNIIQSKSQFFLFYLLIQDFLLDMAKTLLKLYKPLENIHLEGTISKKKFEFPPKNVFYMYVEF